ncbi:shikimate dehydrogenase [Georgenia sunbinii]|uniref:shikimate dehydrogenase n=1 Tax=Georgenia sunbinii TaxID=3117728 RepID=UPI002F26777E
MTTPPAGAPATTLPTYDVAARGSLPAGAKRAAVLGSPIAHSLSPVLHGAAYEALGIDWVYGLAEVDEAGIGSAVAALDEEWGGLSLTMPLKHAAIAHLDVIEPLAEVVGAVNTVIVQPGMLVGANTDVHGVVAALREAADDAGWQPRNAVILGAGATAASSLAALAELGITSSVVLARNPARAAATQLAAHRMGVTINVRRWTSTEQARDLVAGAQVVVSSVPAGAADELGRSLAETLVPGQTAGGVLLDVSYASGPSEIARGYATGGGAIAPGWAMLLHQAAEQVRLMTGRVAPVAAMRSALDAAVAARAG